MKFTKAIVKTPSISFPKGLAAPNAGPVDYSLAMKQHASYAEALQSCGLQLIKMDPEEDFPDATFVEDAALLTSQCAIITNPGAITRKGEIMSMRKVIRKYFEQIEAIHDPGTLEAGDVMMVGDHFYIGLSERTNHEGANQLITILNKFGMSGSMIQLKNVLHLKSAVSYLENNHLAISKAWSDKPEFETFEKLIIPEKEAYAANCIWVNGTVLVPSSHPETKKIIESAGYSVVEVDMTEFEKMNGGLSCLSLRF